MSFLIESRSRPRSQDKYLGPYELGRASVIRSLIPEGCGRPALDLGCGTGFYSKMLADRGWQVTAVDIGQENVTMAMRFSHRGIAGDSVSVLQDLGRHSFDFVMALELIEHLAHGETLLQSVCDRITQNGQFLISTPNRLSPEGLGGYYWGEKMRGWGRWNAWDRTHIKIYSSFEFLRLLRKSGWAVQTVIGYWYRGRLPLGIQWSLPFDSTSRFPMNRFGFNVIALCRAEREDQ